MILKRAAAEYVAAVREVERLEGLTPSEEFAAERAATIKLAKKEVAELYRTLRGADLGAARRELAKKPVEAV